MGGAAPGRSALTGVLDLSSFAATGSPSLIMHEAGSVILPLGLCDLLSSALQAGTLLLVPPFLESSFGPRRLETEPKRASSQWSMQRRGPPS